MTKAEYQRAYQAANSKRLRAYQKAYRAANAARLRDGERAWRDRNQDHVRTTQKARSAAWYLENKERLVPIRKEWALRTAGERAHLVAKYAADRRARTSRAIPCWADQAATEVLYAQARELTVLMQLPWHVDHVVPLRSARVCGLHWHGNLQLLPGVVNVSKGNHTWPDMPV